MPLKLRDEAFQTAAFLIIRLPTPVLNHDSPIEKLFATKPAYFFLRTFRCACWPHLRPYTTHKLSFRSKQCVFLGYNTQHKGYKCLDVATGRVYISCDVVFDDGVFPFSKLHANADAQLCAEISLLPQALLESMSFGGSTTDDASVPKSIDHLLQCCSSQETATVPGALDHLVLSPSDAYFLHQDDVHASSDLAGAVDPGPKIGLDSVAGGANESSSTAPS
jgi:hypothetical protein